MRNCPILDFGGVIVKTMFEMHAYAENLLGPRRALPGREGRAGGSRLSIGDLPRPHVQGRHISWQPQRDATVAEMRGST